MARKRLLIFDADNTLRRTIGATNRPPYNHDEWELLPNVKEKLGQYDWLNDYGFGIASNQASVARGKLSGGLAHELLYQLAVDATGLNFPSCVIKLCPHLPRSCDCRKPFPTMLIEIMKYYDIEPGKTAFVGDAISDKEAALATGCRFILAREFFGK